MDINLIPVKVLVQKCSLLFVVLIVYWYKFICWPKERILICTCIFRFKITLFYTIIIVKSGSDLFNSHFLIVNSNWIWFKTFNFLRPLYFFLIYLIFELYSQTIQKTKIKWFFFDFWRMGIAFSKNNRIFIINLLFLFFIRL